MNILSILLLFFLPIVTPLPLPVVIQDLTSNLLSSSQPHLSNARIASSIIHRLRSEITSGANRKNMTPLHFSNYVYLLLKRYAEPASVMLQTEYMILKTVYNGYVTVMQGEEGGRGVKEGLKEVKGYIMKVGEVMRIGGEAIRKNNEKGRTEGERSGRESLNVSFGGGGGGGKRSAGGSLNSTFREK